MTEPVYVGIDIETEEMVRSVVLGDEESGEWLQIDEPPISLENAQ